MTPDVLPDQDGIHPVRTIRPFDQHIVGRHDEPRARVDIIYHLDIPVRPDSPGAYAAHRIDCLEFRPRKPGPYGAVR
ncbi:hypothetical protein DSECCO2_500960 [anaerobic digester metagenome]